MEIDVVYENYKLQVIAHAIWTAVNGLIIWTMLMFWTGRSAIDLLRSATRRKLYRDAFLEMARVTELEWKEMQSSVTIPMRTGQLLTERIVQSASPDFDKMAGYITLRDYASYYSGLLLAFVSLCCACMILWSGYTLSGAVAAPDDYAMRRLEHMKGLKQTVIHKTTFRRIPANDE